MGKWFILPLEYLIRKRITELRLEKKRVKHKIRKKSHDINKNPISTGFSLDGPGCIGLHSTPAYWIEFQAG